MSLCHSIMSHMLSQNSNLSHILSHCHDSPLTGDACAPPPSRDIPLAMFVSARITILTITPVMIVTMVCSVTNYPLIITLTLQH